MIVNREKCHEESMFNYFKLLELYYVFQNHQKKIKINLINLKTHGEETFLSWLQWPKFIFQECSVFMIHFSKLSNL